MPQGALHPKTGAGAAGTGRGGLGGGVGGAPHSPTHCFGAETGNFIIFPSLRRRSQLAAASSSWGRAAPACLIFNLFGEQDLRRRAANAACVGFSSLRVTAMGVDSPVARKGCARPAACPAPGYCCGPAPRRGPKARRAGTAGSQRSYSGTYGRGEGGSPCVFFPEETKLKLFSGGSPGGSTGFPPVLMGWRGGCCWQGQDGRKGMGAMGSRAAACQPGARVTRSGMLLGTVQGCHRPAWQLQGTPLHRCS